MGKNTLRVAILNATLLMGGTAAWPELAHAQTQVQAYRIEAGDLESALSKFGTDSRIQLIYSPELLKGKQSKGLSGSYTPMEALRRLLEGSGLEAESVNDKTVVIKKARISPRAPAPKPEQRTEATETKEEATELEKIVVTGTYIRNAVPVGSPLRIYSREEIDRSGAATIDQFARQMIENFSSTDQIANSNSSARRFGGSDNSLNSFGGAAFNIRGLGPSATLTLLNGNRMASAGFAGGMTDVSQIPLSAVERFEVLADGASAIYGADAVAGVVNIITRDDFEGAETSVRYGGATGGGAAQLIASQLFGAAWGSGNALLNYQHFKQEDLDASQRDYIPDQGGAVSLVPESRSDSLFLAASQSIGPQTTLSGNAIYAERETLARNHAHQTSFTQDSIQSSDVSQSGISLGLKHDLFGDWVVNLTGNYSRLKQVSITQSFSSITGASSDNQSANSELLGADLLLSGTLAQLSSGALKGAFGASTRDEEFENLTQTVTTNGSFSRHLPDLSRRVNSVYGELRVPVLGGADSPQRLELSAAVRFDDYSDVGSATTYKTGISWSPFARFQLRGTYGTSFRAPLLPDLGSATSYNAVANIPDPAAPNLTNVIIIGGGNPAIGPEESESFTAGFDFAPAFIPNLTIGVTYFDIDFHDRIAAPRITGLFTTNPVAIPFLTRNPALADVQAIFAQPRFQNPSGLSPAAIGAIYDPRITNLSSTEESGVDFAAQYELATDHGDFAFTLSAAHLLNNETQTMAGQPSVDHLNTFAQPPEWKGRAGIAWTQDQWSASLSANYVNSYRNGLGATVTDPGSDQTIDAWATADLYLSYRTGAASSSGLLRDFTIALSVNNLTNEKPPFVEIPASILSPGQRVIPYDAANASPMGRFITLQISKRW